MSPSGDATRSQAERLEIVMPDVRPGPHPSEPGPPPADQAQRPTAVVPVWAGIVVRDLERSARWYSEVLGLDVAERGPGFALACCSDGSAFELVVGDPERPGTAFPSYHDDPGPAVVPGFRVIDPAEAGRHMVVARWLPEWVVVVGPGGLRAVLCCGDGDATTGLVGFDVAGPDPEGLTAWFGGFGARVIADFAPCLQVIPVLAGAAEAELADPDGTALRVTG